MPTIKHPQYDLPSGILGRVSGAGCVLESDILLDELFTDPPLPEGQNLSLFMRGGVTWANDSNPFNFNVKGAVVTYYPYEGIDRAYVSFGVSLSGYYLGGNCISAAVSSDGSLGPWVNASGSNTSYALGSALNTGLVMHFIGGLHVTNSDPTTTIKRFTLNSDGSVSALSDQTFPAYISQAGAVRIGDYAYVVGGYVWSYDSEIDSWSAIKSTTIYRATANGDGTIGAFSLYSSGLPVSAGATACVFVGDPLSPVGGRLIAFCEVDGGTYYDAIVSCPIADSSGNLGSWRTDSTTTARTYPEYQCSPFYIEDETSGRASLVIQDGNVYIVYDVDASLNIGTPVSLGFTPSETTYRANLFFTKNSTTGANIAHCAGGRDADWTTYYTTTYSGAFAFQASGIVCRTVTPDIEAETSASLLMAVQCGTVTPDNVVASISLPITIASSCQSVTPNIDATLRRNLAVSTHQQTETPSFSASMARSLAPNCAATTVTPSVSITIARALVVSPYGLSLTSDVSADVLQGVSLAVNQQSVTPSVEATAVRGILVNASQPTSTQGANASILRPLSFYSGSLTNTQPAGACVERSMSIAAGGESSTPDAEASKAISLSLSSGSETGTPNAQVTIARFLHSSVLQTINISDVSADTSRSLYLSVALESVTPDNVFSSSDLIIKIAASQESVTADAVASIARSVSLGIAQESDTPGVATDTERHLSFSAECQSATPFTDAQTIRDISIQSGGVVFTPDTVKYTVRDLGIVVDTSLTASGSLRSLSPASMERGVSISSQMYSVSTVGADRTISPITAERSASNR